MYTAVYVYGAYVAHYTITQGAYYITLYTAIIQYILLHIYQYILPYIRLLKQYHDTRGMNIGWNEKYPTR